MQLETLIGIACVVLAVICYAGHSFFGENVWLKC